MPAEILTIGTELLLGDSLDTNTAEIARRLRAIGLDVYRTTTVGDNRQRIAAALSEAMARAEVVITTGGLGPTVDDPTREAAADALGVGLEFRDDLWSQIQERFARFGRTPTENNRRQAWFPAGALALTNPIGTAPAFVAEAQGRILIALPGVPAEMAWMMDHEVIPLLRRRLDLPEALHSRTLHASGVGESWVDERIQDLEAMADPTVGVLAHPGRVDIRIAAKAATLEEALRRIDPLAAEIRRRLGPAIYGADGEALAEVALRSVARRGWTLASVETGTRGALATLLASGNPAWRGGLVLPTAAETEAPAVLAGWRAQSGADVGLLLDLRIGSPRSEIQVLLETPDGDDRWAQSYGGPSPAAAEWAANLALDRLRRHLA